MKASKLKGTVVINDCEISYLLKISQHCKQEREYKSNKFESRLFEGLDPKRISIIIEPYLKKLFSNPKKYLFVINKNKYSNEKVCLIIAIDKDKLVDDKYDITVITSLHRDTPSILFTKMEQNNRIYTKYTLNDIMNVKVHNPHEAVKSKKANYKTSKSGLKIFKKVSNIDKYHKYKNISKLKITNDSQKQLCKFLRLY